MHILHKILILCGFERCYKNDMCIFSVTIFKKWSKSMDYFSMYRDVWNFHKKYANEQVKDYQFWEMVMQEGREITKKYNHCKFIINLITGEIVEMERVQKMEE